jgi:UDP-N-acetylmuramate: L-alanyl-gamma-D-glutamyl-meso-diaminopimelate ligase
VSDQQPRANTRSIDGAFDVIHRGLDVGTVRWALSGAHNRMNALAAMAAAEHVGVSPADAVAALSRFGGVKRRMELRGTVADIRVYDDFAHHPTAIETTVAGLRRRMPAGRILAVLEPRSNTMKLGAMKAQLPASLQLADRVFCYGATDGKQALGWSAADALAPLGDRAQVFSDLPALVAAVSAEALPGDHVLVMSNGGFGGVHGKLLAALEQRFSGAQGVSMSGVPTP